MVLRDYQIKDIEAMYSMKKVINANDMGLGKTIEAICLANKVGASKILIICPNSLKWNWLREIRVWADNKDVGVVDGTPKKKERTMAEEHTWYIAGYGSLQMQEDKTRPINPKALPSKYKYRKAFKYPRLDIQWDVVILDESQNVAGRKSQRTIGAGKLNTEYMLQLTGTPITTSPGQLWAQLHIIAPDEFTSYWKFVDNWLLTEHNMFSPQQPKVVGIRDVELFKAMLQRYMIRTEKKDVLTELPAKIYKTIEVHMGTKQAKMYAQMEAESFAINDEAFSLANTSIMRQLRLRQLCLDPQMLGKGFEGVPAAKTEALLEYVDNIPKDMQIVIFTGFRTYANLLYAELSKHSTCVLYTGAQTDTERRAAETSFRSGASRIFIGTIKAGGVGLNLQNASILLFTDKDWSPKINMQVEDRINRMGQIRSPEIVSFVVSNSIEEDIEQLLVERGDMIDSVITSQMITEKYNARITKQCP